MKTTPTTQQCQLASGQALACGARQLVLVEGELLVQAPAQWLAGSVVFAPARRVSAPAVLTVGDSWSVVAVSAARVAVEDPPGLLLGLGSSWRRVESACARIAARLHLRPRAS